MSTAAAADTLTLFYTEGSPYARICRMALRERGLLPNVREEITILREAGAAVLGHNPVGRVPTLVLADGTALTETILIVGWLDHHGAAPGLMTTDASGVAAYGRAVGLLDGVAVWNRELRRPEAEHNAGILALEVERANRVADALERDVSEGGYGRIDAAALTLASALGHAERRHTVWKWRHGRPQLEAWFERMAERESFQATLPPPSGI